MVVAEVDKKTLKESEIHTRYITPAIMRAECDAARKPLA